VAGEAGTAERQVLFGLTFLNVDLDGAVEAVADALAREARGYVVTPNVDHVVRSHRHPALRTVYHDALFCAPTACRSCRHRVVGARSARV
jgi:UDP-N-acetyl-D-mannosaminuronic acid transferase (WecB/TagA/CpsF family)